MKPDYENWLRNNEEEHSYEKEWVWIQAQKEMMVRLIEELEKDLDDLFKGKSQAVGTKATMIAYISSLLNEYKSKKKFLETLWDEH